jgi:hypothetical protein
VSRDDKPLTPRARAWARAERLARQHEAVDAEIATLMRRRKALYAKWLVAERERDALDRAWQRAQKAR